jgi:hypothetical protein
MADAQKQPLENGSISVKSNNSDQGHMESMPEGKRNQTNSCAATLTISKVGFIFVILSLCALVTLAGLGISEWQTHKENTQKQAGEIRAEISKMRGLVDVSLEKIRTEITDLRSLVDASVKEEIICLKIHVLQRKISNETAREIAAAVYKYARIHEREPDLILAIMKVESNFAPEVESKMGAIGLMQIMPQWIDVLGIECSLKNPDCNTRYGLQILGAYELLYGNLDMALTAYNRGPGPVDAALMRGKSPDNGYAGKVRDVYDRLRELNR